MPCRRPGEPCAVLQDEQPPDGLEPQRGGPDGEAACIPDERREDNRPAEIPERKAGEGKEAGKERRAGEGTTQVPGGQEVRTEPAVPCARDRGAQHEVDAGDAQRPAVRIRAAMPEWDSMPVHRPWQMFHVFTVGASMLGWHKVPNRLRAPSLRGPEPVSRPVPAWNAGSCSQHFNYHCQGISDWRRGAFVHYSDME